MGSTHWFELRVAGSAGTRAGAATGIKEGIAVSEEGRLCSVASGQARRFKSERQANEYLGKLKVSGDYHFEAVLCDAEVPIREGNQQSVR